MLSALPGGVLISERTIRGDAGEVVHQKRPATNRPAVRIGAT
jgi:hypothetical protein